MAVSGHLLTKLVNFGDDDEDGHDDDDDVKFLGRVKIPS
jgi:hypothetical protein